MRELLTGNVPSVVKQGSVINTFPVFTTLLPVSYLGYLYATIGYPRALYNNEDM
jgi:hypothetical protein